MNNTKLAKLTFAVLILSFSFTVFGAHKAIFATGGLYNEQVANLRASGFDTAICWSFHVNTSGAISLNNDVFINSSGTYLYGDWARSNIAKLKQSPTTISRLEFSVGSYGAADFEGIEYLINNQGTGPGSILYENFKKLHELCPQVDAINFDDESNYDITTTTQFAVMLADLGFKITFCPYTRRTTFWSPLYDAIEAQRPGAVDHIYLQCYSGGRFNDPATWNGLFGSLVVEPGMWAWEEDNPAEVQAQMESWRKSAGITGGFIWRLGYTWSGGNTPSTYANAIENALAGVLKIETQPESVILSPEELGNNYDIFSTLATSDYPVQYQWYKTTDSTTGTTADDVAIGGDSPIMTIANIQISDVGYYYCLITNTNNEVKYSSVVSLGIKQLMSNWTLDEAKFVDGQYLDETSNHPATPNNAGAVSFIPGLMGEAITIDPLNTWATTASWDPFEYTNQMTVSFWSKWDGVNGTWQVFLNQQTPTLSRRWQISTNKNLPTLWFQGTNTVECADCLVPDVWQHICVVYNEGFASIYIDGQLQASGDFTMNGDAGQLLLGAATTTGSFTLNGSLDDVRIYNYSMDKYDVAELYHSGSGKYVCIGNYAEYLDFSGPNDEPDCQINIFDFAEIAMNWMSCGLYPTCE